MWLRNRKRSIEPQIALREAKARLEEIKAREDEVKEVAGALRDMRRRNHFGEKLERIMTEGVIVDPRH